MPGPRTYVASPLGFTEPTRLWYAEVLLPALAGRCEVVDPWALTDGAHVVAEQAAGRATQVAGEIGRANIAALQGCTRVVAVLDGQEVDSGTAAEVGWATAAGLRVDALRTDLRQAGEPGVPVNLQVVAFIEHSGGRVVGSLPELLALLPDPA